MVSLSSEIMSADQNITDMKSTMKFRKADVKMKRLRANKELEGKIIKRKELMKDAKEK